MRKRLSLVAVAALLSLVVGGDRALAQGPCQWFAGPPTATPFAADPQSGLIAFTVPLGIDGHAYTVQIEIAFLGYLEFSEAGLPLRAVSSHHWRFDQNGVQLEWFAETYSTPTPNPQVIHFASRLELASSNKRYEEGLAFVEGEIDLVTFSGEARGLVGRLCRKP